MAYEIATVTNGNGNYAHQNFLVAVKTLAEANGWTTLRYDDTVANWEWIAVGAGLSGTEEIYIGIQCYQDVGADYYNLNLFTGVGYIAENDFYSQPGAQYVSTMAHNNAIDYWLSVNAQRIMFGLKVGTPVYMYGAVGKFLPYARPGEYPSPLFVAGMQDVNAAVRFDELDLQFPWGGYYFDTSDTRLYVRRQTGAWHRPWCYPFTNKNSTQRVLAGTASSSNSRCLVPAGNYYQMEPIIVAEQDNSSDPSNIFGELDGVFFVSGFNSGPENVIQMGGANEVDQTGMTVAQAVSAILTEGGRAFVVLQNVYRTSWRDFCCLEMKED